MRGWRQEAAALFAWALDELTGAEGAEAAWATLRQHIQALYGWFNVRSERLARAQHLLQQNLAALRAQGVGIELAEVLYHIGVLEWMTGDFAATPADLQADPALYAERGAHWGVVRALNLVGQAALSSGDYAEARRIFDEAHSAALEAEILPAAQDALLGLAHVLAAEGATHRALEQLAQILAQPATLPEARERAAGLQQTLVTRLTDFPAAQA
jgi:hypothetical protein